MMSDQSLVEYMTYIWQFIRLWLTVVSVYAKFYSKKAWRYVNGVNPKKRTLVITKVLAFCEDDPTEDPPEDFTDFATITSWFDPVTWKEDMTTTFSEWKKWKLEIRYVDTSGNKRRLVVRHNENLTWPPPHSSHLDDILLGRAFLTCPDGVELDITKRLEKYVLIRGNMLYVNDLFPMDDHEYNAAHHPGIRLVLIRRDGTAYERELNYYDPLH